MPTEPMDNLLADLDGPSMQQTESVLRAIRRRHLARRLGGTAVAATVLAVAVAVGVGSGWWPRSQQEVASERPVTDAGSGADDQLTTVDTSPAGETDWSEYRETCTATAWGGDQMADRPDQTNGDAWTASPSGEWLRDRLEVAGFGEPLSAGSAFVLAHGIDGAALTWIGPAADTAELALTPVDDVVSMAELTPDVPSAAGGYRPATVMTAETGSVRIWLLVQPRDLHEKSNFGPLPASVPCLPDDDALVAEFHDLVDAAAEVPFDGSVPLSAGAFGVNTDPGDQRLDPSDLYLHARTTQALDGPWDTNGGTAVLSTWIPPLETDPNMLANGVVAPAGAFIAGGVGVSPSAGPNGTPELTGAQLADLRRIEIAMNNEPFIGQHT